MALLLADVTAGLAMLGLARAQARLGRWEASDRWYRFRLNAPLPVTRLLMDAWHGQRPFVKYERLRAMSAFGRDEEAASYGAELAAAPSSPAWLRIAAAAQAVGQLVRVGHFEPALSRLEALLSQLPAAAKGLRGMIHARQLPLLLALARWEEAAACAEAVDREELEGGAGWPTQRLFVLLMREEEREFLRVAKPLLAGLQEQAGGTDFQPDGSFALDWVALVLTARAAEEIGWRELRDQVLAYLAALPQPALPTPALTALGAVAAAEQSDWPAFQEAMARASDELTMLNNVGGQAAETERLLVRAELRAGRYDAALGRARALLGQAISPVGRWRAGRALGEAAEAAGRKLEALEAYRAALATGVETRGAAAVARRIADLTAA